MHHSHKLSFHARPGIQGFCGLAFHTFMFHDLFLTQYTTHPYPGLVNPSQVSIIVRLLLSHANPLLDLPRYFRLGFNLRFGNTECGVFLAHGTIFASSWLDPWTGGLSLWPLGLWDRGSALVKKPWDVQLWPWATVHSCLLVWDMAEGWMFTCSPVHGWRLDCQWAKD